MEPKETVQPSVKPEIQRLHSVKLVIVLLLIMLFPIVSLLAIVRYHDNKRKQQAREFVSQIIFSINEQTPFFREHSEKRALEQIENYDISNLTDNFTVSLNDVYWGDSYVYVVTFDNQHSLIIEVDFTDEGLILDRFRFNNFGWK